MEKILHLLMGAALLFTCATAFSQEKLAHQTDDKSAPAVYFTKDISADGMLKVYEALGWKPEGKTGVKVSTVQNRLSGPPQFQCGTSQSRRRTRLYENRPL